MKPQDNNIRRRARDAWALWLTVHATALPQRTVEDAVDPEDEDEWDPRTWTPATQLGPGAPGRGGVPTIDDDLDRDPDAAPASYPAWGPGETFVVSGPLGAAPDGPGRRFPDRPTARAWALGRYGAVLENCYHADRWAYRVPVPGPAGEKHRPRRNA